MSQLQRLVIAPTQIVDEQVCLTAEQQHYLSRVLRLRVGDRFIAMNGQGQWWLVALTEDLAQGQIIESIAAQTELPIAVNLLMAMPKTGLDDMVRQATELGVTQIVLIRSDRTVLNPSPQKLDRWQRIAQEAAEQSERQVVPSITAPIAWTEALQTWNATNSFCYLCEARGTHPHLLGCLNQNQNRFLISPLPISLAIGPEGGWTESETAAAIAVGYQPVSLGVRVLRAVTAPLMGLSLIAAVVDAVTPNPDQGQDF